MPGVTRPRTGSLLIHKTARGVVVEGEAPQRHSFPVKFLTRELNQAVKANIVIPTTEGDYRYEVNAFDENEWVCTLIETPKPRRRWWQRKK